MPTDPKLLLTPEEVEAVRAEIRGIIQAEGIPATQIAREAGIAYGTFSSWLGGTYAGRNDRIAAEARKWQATRQVRAETQAMAPAAPRFVATPSAELYLALFARAQHLPDFAVLVGLPGTGKSSAACHYTRNTPNVFKVMANPMMGSPRSVLDEIGRLTGTGGAGGLTPHALQRAIVQKLRGIGALIMVDEAQFLRSEALDQLRTLHDEAEVGLVLIGNPSIFGRLEGGSRSAEFAQLFSRVGLRHLRKEATKGDVDALLDAWGLQDEPARKMLHAIARKPGALRGMTKTLKLAHMLAAAEHAGTPGEQHIREAYGMISATDAKAAA